MKHGPSSPIRPQGSGAGTVVSVLLFLVIAWWLIGPEGLAKAWELVGP